MADIGSVLLVFLWPCGRFLAALTRAVFPKRDPSIGLSHEQIFARFPQAPDLVEPISGPAPSRPGVAENSRFKTSIARRLAQNAARFLFKYYAFEFIPAQFWRVFDRTYEPTVAFAEFLRAIGCDPERVRRGDRVEQEKAREVIELLVRSREVLHHIKPRKRDEIGRILQSGDYVRVRELAEVLAHIAAALGMAKSWSGERVIAACASRARELARCLRYPPTTAEGIAKLRDDIARLKLQQERFEGLMAGYDAVFKAIKADWPVDWTKASNEWRAREQLYRRLNDTADHLSETEELKPAQVEEWLDRLAGAIAELDRLAAAAASYGRRSGAREQPRPHGDAAEDLLDDALGCFGFSRANLPDSLNTLRREWKRRGAQHHPDKHMTASKEARAQHYTEYLRILDRFELLVSYFGWARPAGA